MSMKDVKLELDQIEMQQQGLEKQGVRLEQIIRDKCESTTAIEGNRHYYYYCYYYYIPLVKLSFIIFI